MKTFALIGRSGSGKSFRAPIVAAKYNIPLIIDDGLLIKGNKILAGKSAKQDTNFVTAIKTALFYDESHYESVLNTLKKVRANKILIIGTSDKMVNKIIERLELPDPSVIIRIEDIASQDEIATAMRVRYTEGKHVIPVSPVQVTRSYSSIVYDSFKVTFKKWFWFWNKKGKQSESTVVRPQFSKRKDDVRISVAAISQMITQCLYEYGNTMKVANVSYDIFDDGYGIKLTLRTPNEISKQNQVELKEFISDALEKYGGILIHNLEVTIEQWMYENQ